MAEEGASEVGFCNVLFRIPSLIRWQPLPTIMFTISGYSFLDLELQNIEVSLTNFMRILGNLGNLLATVQ